MNTRKTIALAIIFPLLFSQMVRPQNRSDIRLPTIPIYFERHYDIPNYIETNLTWKDHSTIQVPSGFSKVSKVADSFIAYQITQVFQYKNLNEARQKTYDGNTVIIGSIGCIGTIIAMYYSYKWGYENSEGDWNPSYETTTAKTFDGILYSLVGGLATAVVVGGVFQSLGSRPENSYLTTISTSIEEIGGYKGIIKPGKVYFRDQFFTSTKYGYVTDYNVGKELSEIIENNYNNWYSAQDLLKRYRHYNSLEKDYRKINQWRSQKLIHFGRQKGEFETTLQYQERLKQEELSRRSIESEYQQKIVQFDEENETIIIKLRRDIEQLADEIRFEKSYDFSISRYDADKQTFTFTINKSGSDQPVFFVTKDVDNIRSGPSTSYPVIAKCYKGDKYEYVEEGDNGWHAILFPGKRTSTIAYIHQSNGYVKSKQGSSLTKKLVVPIAEARNFKWKSKNLVVKQMVKPSLDGRWIPVYDDVVLADRTTGDIIPWEGEVPTYATAPVSNPPVLTASVVLSEPSGEGYLDAEELATLKVTLTNSGSGPAKTTRISISQESGPTLYYHVSATVASIAPGNSHTERFQITVPENVTDGKVAYTISFLEAQGFEPQPVKFTAEVRAQREPLLTLVDFGVVDQNGDGKVSKGESAEITARIQNRGQGKAKGVSVKVLEDPTKNIFLAPYSEKEFKLGDIPAGESRDVIFTVVTNNRVADLVNVELKLTEKRPRFSKSGYVNLEIDKQQSRLQPLAFTGSASDVAIADLATLSVDIEQDIPRSKTKNPNALAVVFGVENYKNVSAVTFAKRDASYMKEYFEKTLGIPADKIYYKIDDDVTKGEFDKVFSKDGWLDKRIKKEGKTNVFIYYAGHGAPEIKENKAYLIPYDGDPNYASQTGYALDVLYANLGNLKARSVTLFLDACFTGANRESEILLAGARPMFMEVNPSAAGNITIFSAASGKEISSAWPEKRHGLFSYFLMKGMRGDGDANKDGQLTMDELGSYIQTNVSRQAGFLDREQTPQLQTLEKGKVLIQYK